MNKERKQELDKMMKCIHIGACRRINFIANKQLYGSKGTKKMARGCNENCSCFFPIDRIKEQADMLYEDDDEKWVLDKLIEYIESNIHQQKKDGSEE